MAPTTIAFVLFPHLHLEDLAGPAQVFYEASNLGNQNFRTVFASMDGIVTSSQGLALAPQAVLKELSLRKGDMICVPGVDFKSFQEGKLDAIVEQTRDWMWEQQKKGIFIASICTGALILGRMGLLDYVSCTSHWKCLDYMRGHFPKARVLDNRLYVFDKGIFTSAGMTSGIDMSLALVERWRNPLLAAKVAQEMVINVRRPETKAQKNIFLDFKNHLNAEVYKAQEILANQLDATFTIEDLARQMNLSPRHLSRLFKRHTGQTVQAFRDNIRLEHGEQLLLHTERSVKEIAVACGFANARQFSRLWQRKKGGTPGEFRKF